MYTTFKLFCSTPGVKGKFFNVKIGLTGYNLY